MENKLRYEVGFFLTALSSFLFFWYWSVIIPYAFLWLLNEITPRLQFLSYFLYVYIRSRWKNNRFMSNLAGCLS